MFLYNFFFSLPQIYDEFYHTVNNADYEKDLKWWSNNHGVNMAMNWPQFEVMYLFSPYAWEVVLPALIKISALVHPNFLLISVQEAFYSFLIIFVMVAQYRLNKRRMLSVCFCEYQILLCTF